MYQQIYDEAIRQGSDHWEANFIAMAAVICVACERGLPKSEQSK